ncbi:MAG: hypothetical protein JO103_11970 [Candidatus Eremiobacteraeota bacterium]|nr:hypothetical protein [Candidatus Eremiobacteraeota bacterium]MBV9409734.1 hypothetical protein [Candidatus Eremiobacteraeota bacterium]
MLALLLAAPGCAGGHDGTLTPAANTPGQKGTAVFRITIPKAPSLPTARTRTPKYISFSTKAMTLAISGPTNVNQTVALTPTSPNCSSTASGTQCTLNISLLRGNYTATLNTYDGFNSGTGMATGNVLSTGQNLAFTINQGQVNSIALTLSGIPKSMVVLPSSPLGVVNAANSFHLVGAGAHPFQVAVLDADGNAIVGAGAPTFTIGAPTGSLGATAQQPLPASPNTFNLTPPSTFTSGTSTFAVNATYTGQPTDGCAQPGAVCSVSISVDMQEAVVVAWCGKCATGTDSVKIYPDGSNVELTTISSSSLINTPKNVVTDASGNIYVYNAASDSVQELLAPNFTSGPTYGGGGSVMAIGPDGKLYIVDRDNNSDRIFVYQPPSNTAIASLDPSGGNFSVPEAFAFASNGDIWFTDSYNQFIYKYSAPLTSSSTPAVTLGGLGVPAAMAIDPTGNLFIANEQDYTINKFATPQTTGESRTSINYNPQSPRALASDASGNLYYYVWPSTEPPAPTQLVEITSAFTGHSAGLQITADDETAVTQLDHVAISATGVYTLNRSTSPSVFEANFALTTGTTITNGGVQPWGIAVEP